MLDTSLGVVVGRFQVNELTMGHRQLISYVQDRYLNVVVVIGDRNSPPTERNPLPYFARYTMIRKEFPNVIIVPLMDCESNEVWSRNLDTLIQPYITSDGAILFHGRDGMTGYTGKHQMTCLDFNINEMSATKRRASIQKMPKFESVDFRAGIIYAHQELIPRVYETADAALVRRSANGMPTQVLLGRKADSQLWRFPGGHVEPGELSVACARRELFEETGLHFESSPRLLGEVIIDDWRTRDTTKAYYKTFFYVGPYTFGVEKALDDLADVRWFHVSADLSNKMVPEHRILLSDYLIPYIESPDFTRDSHTRSN